jgi:hypothetical protein
VEDAAMRVNELHGMVADRTALLAKGADAAKLSAQTRRKLLTMETALSSLDQLLIQLRPALCVPDPPTPTDTAVHTVSSIARVVCTASVLIRRYSAVKRTWEHASEIGMSWRVVGSHSQLYHLRAVGNVRLFDSD